METYRRECKRIKLEAKEEITTTLDALLTEERVKALEEAATVSDKMAWCGYAVDISKGI